MNIVSKILSLCLAIVFLLSSLGFTANKMICLKSGKTTTSFIQLKDCCPEKKSSDPVLEAHCCEIMNNSFCLDDFQSSTQNHLPVAIRFVLNYSGFSSFLIPVKTVFTSQISNPSISLAGRKLLSFIRIFII